MRIVAILFMSAVFSPAAIAQTSGCAPAGDSVCAPTGAAILGQIGGEIRVSRGPSFVSAGNGVALRPGDRVLVGRGEGVLSLGPTCSVPLRPNTVLQLSGGENTVCVQSMSQAAGPLPDSQSLAASGLSRAGTGAAYVAGAALVGGGVAAALASRGSNSKSSPVSP